MHRQVTRLISIISLTALVSGREWIQIHGKLTQVSGSLNYAWGVNNDSNIFMCQRPCTGHNWEHVPVCGCDESVRCWLLRPNIQATCRWKQWWLATHSWTANPCHSIWQWLATSGEWTSMTQYAHAKRHALAIGRWGSEADWWRRTSSVWCEFSKWCISRAQPPTRAPAKGGTSGNYWTHSLVPTPIQTENASDQWAFISMM